METISTTVQGPKRKILVEFDYEYDLERECCRVPIYDRYWGKVAEALVDLEDIDKIKSYKWRLHSDGHVKRTVCFDGDRRKGQDRSRCRSRDIDIGYTILNQSPQQGLEIDHRDGDSLNNRRTNLRICTHQQNLMNMCRFYGTSKFKGVYWESAYKKWHARIYVDCKNVFLGLFDIEKDAAKAYNDAATKYFGEFAKLNNLA